jgi:hypothetical protein
MTFTDKLALINVFTPPFTAIVTMIGMSIIVPAIVNRWTLRKVRACYHSLMSYFHKVCRRLGSGNRTATVRETCFETDSEVETLIEKDQYVSSRGNPGWGTVHLCYAGTALNAARCEAGLEKGKFYRSHRFLNAKYGELLVVLTVKDNTAEIKAFTRGEWKIPQDKIRLSRWLRRLRVRFFGNIHPDYSIMLV